MLRIRLPLFVAAACVLLSAATPARSIQTAGSAAASNDTGCSRKMRWRGIGPLRAGRTKAATGVPQQPNVFYMAAVNGGVWKSTDFGNTWTPIFDDQPTGSVGAIAVAPSNPDNHLCRQRRGTAAPRPFDRRRHLQVHRRREDLDPLGLRDGQQIPQIIVDPGNPDRLFVAVLGHPYGPNEERGVFRSTDGGRTFQKVLYKDADSGAVDLVFDPSNANHVYAVLWQARQGPWENGVFTGPNSGLFESTDGGNTWNPLTKGLPTVQRGTRTHRDHGRAERPEADVCHRAGGRRRTVPIG
jgi:hypothetical protein